MLPIASLEMHRLSAAFVLCIAAFACSTPNATGDPPPAVVVSPTTTMPVPSTTTTIVASTSTTISEGLSVESLQEGISLVLAAREAVEVFAAPGDAEPIRSLEQYTILGTTTVLRVLEGPVDGWARVMLPGRPNGAEGWVRSEGMVHFVVDGWLTVDLSERALSFHTTGGEVLTAEVAIGTERNPTPTGTFFVTDNVTVTSPNSVWGPYALGLSARSETITEYNGGDGIIGIHGTNRPESIGEPSSLGCVRVPNEVITRLHEVVSIGTPVDIRS